MQYVRSGHARDVTEAANKPYGLVVAGPAARAINDELPEAVAWAVIELITGALLENPRRLSP